jgi:hypothetical protein
MRRFFVRDKKITKAILAHKKCAGAKHHKGACADWCFAEAEPPQGGEAHTDLLGDGKICSHY